MRISITETTAGRIAGGRFAVRVAPEQWLSLVVVAAGFAGWELITLLRLVPPDLLPGPGAVAATFFDILRNGYRETTLSQDIFATLYRCGAGFLLACVTGVPLGLLMGYRAKIGSALDPIVQFMRPLPPLSYLVLLILWLGTGNASKIALLFLSAFPIIVSSAMAGVRSVRIQKLQVARSLGANEWQVFRFVILPSALPMIFTGARIALAVAFSTVVAAELMAATDGLGWMVFSASHFLRNDIIIMAVLLLGLLGMLLNSLVLVIDKGVIHWRGVE
ncbi:MAG TPA: ABC transporter permease [Acetobacteraceae bacterium]|nr:ABC transporter permease [Acetobacteraceae bacterium]